MSRSLLYLSRADVESLELPFGTLVDTVRQVFREKGLGQVESPPKRGVIPASGCSIRGMMAWIPSLRAAGVKWISAFPPNAERGEATINGLVTLNDPDTGHPVAVMDCGWITAARSAASTLVAAEVMARPESSRVGILACGQQGLWNLQALCGHFPVSHVKVFDIRREAAEAFARDRGRVHDVPIEVVDTPDKVARDVDILVTSLPIERRPKPPLDAGMLAPGCFAALLDYNAAMTPAGMAEADRMVTDDQAQLRFFRSIGYFRGTPEPDGDLGKVVAGRQVGRLHDDERVIAINQGIGVLDIATAALLLERAEERGVGVRLPL